MCLSNENTNPDWRCSDCKHEHGDAPHGFCVCGCTYPGQEEGEPEPLRDVVEFIRDGAGLCLGTPGEVEEYTEGNPPD